MADKALSPDQRQRAKSRRFHVAAKDREYLISNIALLIKSGVTVGEALESLQETSHSSALKKALEQMRTDINEGLSLWQTLERSGVVNQQTLVLVKLGEQSGHLIENLAVAAKQEEKQRILRAKVRSALIYPLFVMSLTLVVGLGVSWFLLPRLSDTFTQMNLKLPLISQIFINFGLFLKENGLWAVPTTIFVLFLTIYIFFVAPATKSVGTRLLFHLPGISRMMYEVELARFGYLMGTLLETGMPITEALIMMEQSSSAPRYRQLYRRLERSFDEGYSFRRSFQGLTHTEKLLPSVVQQMIIAGERSGALSTTLTNIGEIYETKVDITAQNLEVILEPIMLVIVWAGVLGVAIAVILPVYSLVGNLGGT